MVRVDRCFGHVIPDVCVSLLTMQAAWQALKHWFKHPFDLFYTASPLISFQSPPAEFRLTLMAMAVKVPVWRDCTSVAVLTPAAKPRAIFPRMPLPPRHMEEPLFWLQTAADLEKVSPRGAILKWPRREVGGFFTKCWLPGDKMCLNLAPAPWKLAVIRGRGPVHRGDLYAKSADICSAMPQYHQK